MKVTKLADIDGLDVKDATKVGLRLVFQGIPYRTAAKAAGVDHKVLMRVAKTHEISQRAAMARALKANPDMLIEQKKLVAVMADAELMRRLEERPSGMSDGVLNAISGTATDKIAVKEGWSKANQEDPNSWLKVVVEQMAKLKGTKITLEVEPGPAEPERLAIDAEVVPDKQPDPTFEEAAQRTLDKNEKLYQQLAE